MQNLRQSLHLISAEMLFSLPSCVIMLLLVGRGLAPAVMKDFVLCNGGTKAPPYKGVWALPDVPL